MLPVNFRDRDTHIDEDGDGCAARQQSGDQEYAADEFDESGNISEPGRHTETVNVAGVFLHVAVNLVRAMSDKNDAESQAAKPADRAAACDRGSAQKDPPRSDYWSEARRMECERRFYVTETSAESRLRLGLALGLAPLMIHDRAGRIILLRG